MSLSRATVFAAVLTVLVAFVTSAQAQDYSFKAFSDVTSVCPQCEPPASDVLTLRDGREVRGTVVAINPAFYTVSRYGEVRTIPRNDVQSVKWEKGSQPAGLDALDQIVLKNGHVLTGNIVVTNEKPAYYQIKSSTLEYTYTVFVTQAAKVFKKGQEASK
ncbi:MAG: hypothetical protein H0U74_15620 [Bradymonadaceae bacterium]|nr:hypothetical protein [Lujinxingiaceae bacterium]